MSPENPIVNPQPVLYNAVITSVNSSTFAQAVTELARSFSLSSEVSAQILNSYPIVFLSGLNKADLEAIKSKLLKLSHPNLGIEFLISTKLPPTTPRVVWPTPTHYKQLESGEVVRYVDFQWRGSAFVCPGCGETFLFRRVGNPLVLRQGGKPAGPEKTTAAQAPLSREIPASQTGLPEPEPIPVLEPIPIEVSAGESGISGDVMELQPLSEVGDEVMELAPLEEIDESAAVAVPEPIDILDNAEAIKEEESATSEPVEITPESIQNIMPETVIAGGATCSVFLSTIGKKEKKEQAAKLIAQLKNISLAEATQLLSRMLVPVLKDVSDEEAKKCLDEFKKIGVAGRVTKKKR